MFLSELWYLALPGARVRAGRTAATVCLSTPLLIGRTHDGTPFALRDICPHRAMPLSLGRFDGRELECCYHGWRFDPAGRCTAIPSLAAGDKLDLGRIRVQQFPCREVQGNIWVWFGKDRAELPDVPRLPEIGERAPQLFESVVFRCGIDHAVAGLMDPAHGPYVHNAWWWRSRRSSHEKSRAFEPAELGWRMVRHRPSRNSAGYRILGGAPSTEIGFRLPGVRIEHVKAGRHVLCGLTAVTPIDERTTRINHAIYWTMPWLTLLKPFLRPFARAFLDQDRRVVELQQAGLAYDPPLIMIDDADTLVKWYLRLKKDYAAAVAEGRPFVNPLSARTLRWRS